jgi:hypothetical protein
MTTIHETIRLKSGDYITPVRVYRLRGGYRLLVTAERAVWQEFDGRYTLLATGQDWRGRCPCDDTINRANACRVANFFNAAGENING